MEFSLNSYRDILKTGLEEGLKFLDFSEARAYKGGRSCILRHDIDIDMEAAHRMARIEADLGVFSTYFLMLRSPVYNLFGRANFRYAQSILDMGHHLGLHYDEGFTPEKDYDLNEWVEKEARVLSDLLKKEIAVVSFHQPGQRVLQNEIKLLNFLNTYDKEDMSGITYYSDSNMQFRVDPFTLMKDSSIQKLQILIHPVWWMGEGASLDTEQLWDRALKANFYRTQEQILATERAFGPARRIHLEKES